MSKERDTTRVEAFSDGVFAIAITLLGVTLEIPDANPEGLLPALAQQWPAFLAFATSFVTIGIIWINHHRLFTHIRHVSHGLLLLNGLLLMTVVLAPFTTSLVAKHLGGVGARDASVVYATSLVLVTGSFNLLWRHVTRTPGVVDDHVTTHAVRRINIQYGFGPLLYVASMVVATFSALASILVDIALAVFFALPAFTFADARGRRERSRSCSAHPSAAIPRS